jgi:hypothetical protein
VIQTRISKASGGKKIAGRRNEKRTAEKSILPDPGDW